MAIVFPAPGGPVTEVSEPRTPSAMSFSMRGRPTAHPGTSGTVTLDIRTGSSVSARPRKRTIPRTSVLDILVVSLSGDVIRPAARPAHAVWPARVTQRAAASLSNPHPYRFGVGEVITRWVISPG